MTTAKVTPPTVSVSMFPNLPLAFLVSWLALSVVQEAYLVNGSDTDL